jgi:hypothetical protein
VEYATLNALAIELLFELFNEAAAAEQFVQRTASGSRSGGGQSG